MVRVRRGRARARGGGVPGWQCGAVGLCGWCSGWQRCCAVGLPGVRRKAAATVTLGFAHSQASQGSRLIGWDSFGTPAKGFSEPTYHSTLSHGPRVPPLSSLSL